ncbi:hypothetical protein [Oceanirhabdus sp. W0125-5]|uniref:hypothetical protein n=1 Tax=Oceanirhabdus sp. W0125-5 TaxID=2999116 RepID=UPI0022F32F54|nr:hypothetical protein [Oceanirhabdus sp. W0125-5]WBW98224.1 hypothetical protein OW730_05510 [Oceanirhabdus sp. W0125-5]
MKKYNVLFLIVLLLFITSQVAIIIEKYDLKRYITRNITIENIPLNEHDRLLLRSENTNSSFLFKLNGLRKNYTYEIHIWVENCTEGKIIKNTILLDSINTFSTKDDLKQTYLLITFTDTETQCVVFLKNQSDIISSCRPIGNINSSRSVSIKDTKTVKDNSPVTILAMNKNSSEEYTFHLKIRKFS